MNKLLIILLAVLIISCQKTATNETESKIPALLAQKSKVLLEKEGQTFRDLNGNGELDIYEDINQPIAARVDDLLRQMKLEEKAGMMFMQGAPVSTNGEPDEKAGATGPALRMPTIVKSMDSLKMTYFNVWDIPDEPAIFAKWYNNMQQVAEKARLGIPVTISSDPRHHLGQNVIGMAATGFSQFCEMPGFAALGDEALVREFADIVRQEYLAIGIREALHPQIDLATEPRWARISGNFSEDAELTARLVNLILKDCRAKI